MQTPCFLGGDHFFVTLVTPLTSIMALKLGLMPYRKSPPRNRHVALCGCFTPNITAIVLSLPNASY